MGEIIQYIDVGADRILKLPHNGSSSGSFGWGEVNEFLLFKVKVGGSILEIRQIP